MVLPVSCAPFFCNQPMNDSEQIPHTVRLPNDSEMVQGTPEKWAVFGPELCKAGAFLAGVLAISAAVLLLLNLSVGESPTYLFSTTLPAVIIVVLSLMLRSVSAFRSSSTWRHLVSGGCLLFLGVSTALFPPADWAGVWLWVPSLMALVLGTLLCIDWFKAVRSR